MKGNLYLIPATLGDTPVDQVIPTYVKAVVSGIKQYIVENERSARRMLIKLGISTPIDELKFLILDEHTDVTNISHFLDNIEEGDIGVLSEAGVPCIADPGSEIVALAHSRKIKVVPLVGPSSILMSVMASGLNGQNFAFNGYLPIKSDERIKKLKQLEYRSKLENQSQLFIEAPYRNNQLLKDIITACHENTRLCIASEISTKDEMIATNTVVFWKNHLPDLHKKTVIYIIQA
jgi:16S rRNA (cytidine1402-2'-O)-methyltransferase